MKYMDREFISTPFGSTRIFNLGLLSAINGVTISCISSHFRFNETVKSNSIVSTCNNYIDQLVKTYSIVSSVIIILFLLVRFGCLY